MVNGLKDQLTDPQFWNMAFKDRIGLQLDEECKVWKNNLLNKLVWYATSSDLCECLRNVEYLPDRGLKQEERLRIGT